MLGKRIFYLIFPVLIAACATPTRELSQDELEEAFDGYVARYMTELGAIGEKSLQRLRLEAGESVAGNQSYDVLVLSGGGELGAFGAGFLKGWGEIESGEFVRPEFDSVSGISTGSLIAPFAFVGTDEAYETVLHNYRNPDQGLVVGRGTLSFLFGHEAYFDASKLYQRIRDGITPDLIRAIAAGSAQNRSLLVGATNLDYGMMRVWDLSQIAADLDEPDAIDKITTRLIASSAIPAIFPPVKIDGFMYVDGGASMQVVGGLEDREWLYQNQAVPEEISSLVKKPRRIRIWVVINNKLLMEPEVTSLSWSGIAGRSLASLVRASTLQTLQDLETFSHMVNLRPEFDMQMYYVAIPQGYEIPETEFMFDPEKMRNLADLGERMGTNAASWRQRALLPTVPMLQNQQ